MNYHYERPDQVQKYSGRPKGSSDQEISIWKKFLKVFLPWVTRKWELGNAYLEAKVVKEINEANKIKAETDLLQIQAEKEMQEIIEKASYEDEVNEIITPATQVSEGQILVDIENFIENIKLRYIKYGLKISFSVEYEQSSGDDEVKMQDQVSKGEDISNNLSV